MKGIKLAREQDPYAEHDNEGKDKRIEEESSLSWRPDRRPDFIAPHRALAV
jgi:hypothetical protein